MKLSPSSPPLNCRQFVIEALGRGVHPSQIRARLAALGLSWQYVFTGYDQEEARRIGSQGNRERARRLARVDTVGCESEGCPNQVPKDRALTICDACLIRKWGEDGSIEAI